MGMSTTAEKNFVKKLLIGIKLKDLWPDLGLF